MLSLGTISAAFCLVLIALFYAGLHKVLKGEVCVAALLVGIWAAVASLVSSPRTSIGDGGQLGGSLSFENSAAFYCSWVALVVALLLCYWAASDAGLKVPLPEDTPAAEAAEATAADPAEEPVKPGKADPEEVVVVPTPPVVGGADVEAVSEAV